MNKLAALVIPVSACLFCVGSVDAGKESIPDKSLEAALREVLREPTAKLTDEKLNNVFVLHANKKGIRNLAGLEKCKNLQEIRLAENEITDVKPLAGLTNLLSLDLAKNKIVDVAPLKGLERLQFLELTHNQIVNVAPLSGLSSLASLYLTDNKISDIGPLAKLSRLASLSLGKNQIQNIAALAQVTKINTLELKDNQIVDIAPLAKQTDLRLLMMENNKISDLAPLVTACEADAKEPRRGPAQLIGQALGAQVLAPGAGPMASLMQSLVAVEIAEWHYAFGLGPMRFAPFLRIYLAGNPLSPAAKTTQIDALKKIGVRIEG
jgi:internalin A